MKQISLIENVRYNQVDLLNKISEYSVINAKLAIQSGQNVPGIVGGRDSLKVTGVSINPDKKLNITINPGYAISETSLEEVNVQSTYQANTDVAYTGDSATVYVGLKIYKSSTDPRSVYGQITPHNITRFNTYTATLSTTKDVDDPINDRAFIWLEKITITAGVVTEREDIRQFCIPAGHGSKLFNEQTIADASNPLALDYNVFNIQNKDRSGSYWDTDDSFYVKPFSGYKKDSGVISHVSRMPVEDLYALEVTNKVGASRRSEIKHQISVPSEASEDINVSDVVHAYGDGFKLFTNTSFVNSLDEKKRLYPDQSRKSSLEFTTETSLIRYVHSSEAYGELGIVKIGDSQALTVLYKNNSFSKRINIIPHGDQESETIELKLPRTGGILATQASVLAESGKVSVNDADPAAFLNEKLIQGGGITLVEEQWNDGGTDKSRIRISLSSASYFATLSIGPNSGNVYTLTSKNTGQDALVLARKTGGVHGGLIVGAYDSGNTASEVETRIVATSATAKNITFQLPLSTTDNQITKAVWSVGTEMFVQLTGGVAKINFNGHEGKTFTISGNGGGTVIATTADISAATSGTAGSTYTIDSDGDATHKSVILAGDGYISFHKENNTIGNLTKLRAKEYELGNSLGGLKVITDDHIELNSNDGTKKLSFNASELYKGANNIDNNILLSRGELTTYLNTYYTRKENYEYESGDLLGHVLASTNKDYMEVGKYAKVSDFGVFIDASNTPQTGISSGGKRESVTHPSGRSISVLSEGALYWDLPKFVGNDDWRPYVTIQLAKPVNKIHSIVVDGLKHNTNIVGFNPAVVTIEVSTDGTNFISSGLSHVNTGNEKGVWKDVAGYSTTGYITHVRFRVNHIPGALETNYIPGGTSATRWGFTNISIIGSEAQGSISHYVDGFEYVSPTGILQSNEDLKLVTGNNKYSALKYRDNGGSNILDLGSDFDYVNTTKPFTVQGGTSLSYGSSRLNVSTATRINGDLQVSTKIQLLNGSNAYDALVRSSTALYVGDGFASIYLRKNTNVEGNLSATGTASITGAITGSNNLTIRNTTSSSKDFLIYDNNNAVEFKLRRITSGIEYYIPSGKTHYFKVGSTTAFSVNSSEVNVPNLDVGSLEIANKSALSASGTQLNIGTGFTSTKITSNQFKFSDLILQQTSDDMYTFSSQSMRNYSIEFTPGGVEFDTSGTEFLFHKKTVLGTGTISSRTTDFHLQRANVTKLSLTTTRVNIPSNMSFSVNNKDAVGASGNILYVGEGFTHVDLHNDYLQGVRDPINSSQVGDRGYNDARYAPKDTPYMEVYRTFHSTSTSTRRALAVFNTGTASSGLSINYSRGSLRIPPYTTWLISYGLNFALSGGGAGMHCWMTAHTTIYTTWQSSASQAPKSYALSDPSDGESGATEEFLLTKTFLYRNTSSSFRYLQMHYEMLNSNDNQILANSVFTAVQVAG